MYDEVKGIGCLRAFDFDFLRERFAADYPQHADHFEECRRELCRFLELPLRCNGPLAAMSYGVDHLWHTLILHTPQYRSFCDKVYGGYLDHQPRSDAIPVPAAAISNFFVEYPKRFGEVPPIWFENMPARCIKPVSRGEVPPEVLQLQWSGWPGRK